MKLAISATGKDLNARIDPRLGRAPYFAIVDTETMDLQVVDNENMNRPSGAGIQTAGCIAAQGVGAVLTGNCGPKALEALSTAGIKVFTGHTGTIREAVEHYRNGDLTATVAATVPEQSGAGFPKTGEGFQPRPGSGMGGGMGRCGGRGRGGGGGRGMGGCGRGGGRQ